MARQDAMFYVNNPSFEMVAKYGQYEVVRNGYMRLYNNTTEETYRYTDDLERAGYADDKHLAFAIDTEELNVMENPWFEVWDSEDLDPDPEVFDTHQQACKHAWELAKQEIEEYVR